MNRRTYLRPLIYGLVFIAGVAAAYSVNMIVQHMASILPGTGDLNTDVESLNSFLNSVTLFSTLIIYGGGIAFFNYSVGKYLAIKPQVLKSFLVTACFGLLLSLLISNYGDVFYNSPAWALFINTLLIGGIYMLGVYIGLFSPSVTPSTKRRKV